MSNLVSRTIIGGIMTAVGVALIILAFFTFLITLIYGVPILIVGLFILFNKKEDRIENRKDLNKVRGKR